MRSSSFGFFHPNELVFLYMYRDMYTYVDIYGVCTAAQRMPIPIVPFQYLLWWNELDFLNFLTQLTFNRTPLDSHYNVNSFTNKYLFILKPGPRFNHRYSLFIIHMQGFDHLKFSYNYFDCLIFHTKIYLIFFYSKYFFNK